MPALLICLAVLAFPLHSNAASIPVPNGSFESPALADGSSLATVGSPWIPPTGATNPPTTENPLGPGTGVIDGEQRLRLNSLSGSSTGISQILSTTFQPNTAYVLSVVPIDVTGSVIPGFQVLLSGLAARTLQPTELSGALGSPVSVSGVILPGDPLIGTNIEIGIYVIPDHPTNVGVSFDDVQLQAFVIPEPSTAALLALGLAGIWLRRRQARSV
jgi:hypothetical protein